MIGEFEYLLLAAAARLAEGAYGAAIRMEVERTAIRECSLGALYTTLNRLESKGLLKTWMGEPTQERGGRAKRMVELTAKGHKAAEEFYDTVARASHGVTWSKGKRLVQP